jgi:hypothetical protein
MPVILVAASEPLAAEPLAAALRLHGGARVLADGEPLPADLDAAVLCAGRSWQPFDAHLEALYRWIAEALPRFGERGLLVLCGPPVVATPGRGYPEYVKARLVLGNLTREIAREAPGVTAITVWGDTAASLAAATIRGLRGTARLRSVGASPNA